VILPKKQPYIKIGGLCVQGGRTMWSNYFKQLETYLKWQQAKIIALEQKVAQLQKEYAELKKRPQMNIEKMEYHFDQLKVETLEGTLNIGLTPASLSDGNIEDFAVTKGKTIVPQSEPLLFRNIQTTIQAFLQAEGKKMIQNLEKRFSYQLDDYYRQFILQDIARQLDERIRFYLNQTETAEKTNEQIQEEIIGKIKRDIEHSIESFLKHLPREEQHE
jgi:spore germination protein PC